MPVVSKSMVLTSIEPILWNAGGLRRENLDDFALAVRPDGHPRPRHGQVDEFGVLGIGKKLRTQRQRLGGRLALACVPVLNGDLGDVLAGRDNLAALHREHLVRPRKFDWRAEWIWLSSIADIVKKLGGLDFKPFPQLWHWPALEEMELAGKPSDDDAPPVAFRSVADRHLLLQLDLVLAGRLTPAIPV